MTNATKHAPKVGAPDPELKNSPIFNSTDESELSLDLELETGVCYFNAQSFAIGSYDRVEERIIRVPMREIFFEPGDHFAFDLYDHGGELHSIPLHRVKQVFRNGELIWHREH